MILLLAPFNKLVVGMMGGIWKIKKRISARNKLFIGIYYEYFEKQNSYIGYNAEICGIPCFPHGPKGVFISGDSRIGKNVVIFQQVTIGSNTIEGKGTGSPNIGDNVYIGSGAKIIGKVNIGNNCRIGANAVVYMDMPDNSVAVQAPTRVIVKDKVLDNRYYSKKDGNWVYFENGNWVFDLEKK